MKVYQIQNSSQDTFIRLSTLGNDLTGELHTDIEHGTKLIENIYYHIPIVKMFHSVQN